LVAVLVAVLVAELVAVQHSNAKTSSRQYDASLSSMRLEKHPELSVLDPTDHSSRLASDLLNSSQSRSNRKYEGTKAANLCGLA